MNILELAILKKMVGGGGGSGTDNYNDLSNLPQINGETLVGNKTAENLGLQDALTFDSTPTEDSTNPVESGGVYNALAGKQDNLTFDDDPTENSTNPVKSGGVYSALAGKQDNLTFDGVYNASTNKAATESTVTNAIAGLDVSAFSVDADETISSISETDGKVSVTKQDIAIASNQVVAMTGYTKPSSAPANPAIQTNDTANQAFGKLEFKADTNQSNILYACERVGKNLFDITSPDSTRNTTVTPLDNGGATLSCSSAMWTQYYKTIPTEIGKEYKVVLYIDNISGVGSNEFIVSFKRTNPEGSNYAEYENITTTGTHEATFTATVNTLCVAIFLNNSATSKTSSANVRIMICEKNIYDIVGSDYERFALPNYDLTYLEAQDRAALAEEIDAGAKNLVDLSATGTGTHNDVTFTNLGNNRYKINGTPSASDTHLDIMGTWSSVPSFISNNVGKTIVFTTNQEHIYYGIIPIVGGSPLEYVGGNKSTPVAYTIPNNLSGALLRIYVDTNQTYSNVTAELLACTKAAFGVSNKFVPYRPNWDLVAQKIAMSEWYYSEANYSPSVANQYVYTGFSFTVPANQIFEFLISDRNKSSADNYSSAIMVSDSATDTAAQSSIIAENTQTISQGSKSYWMRTVCGMTPFRSADTTYYIWVNRGSTSSSGSIVIMYRRIH